jgi:hypothetical protein
MKYKDESELATSPHVDTKEKRTETGKGNHRKNSTLSWAILVVLIFGLIAFLAANTDILARYFPQSNPSISSNSGCSSSRDAGGIQSGVNLYNSNCRTQTKEYLDEKRWQNILQASPVVIAAASVVTAGTLIALTWQVSRLVRAVSKKD